MTPRTFAFLKAAFWIDERDRHAPATKYAEGCENRAAEWILAGEMRSYNKAHKFASRAYDGIYRDIKEAKL